MTDCNQLQPVDDKQGRTGLLRNEVAIEVLDVGQSFEKLFRQLDEALDQLATKGAKAWREVTNPTEWVDQLRGN